MSIDLVVILILISFILGVVVGAILTKPTYLR